MPVAVSWDGEGQAAAGYLATLSSQEACFCHRQSRAAGWQAKYPSSRAGLQPSCSTPGLCCLRASLSNLTALSVLGQDTNSWSSIMRLPPVCPACLLGRACGLLRAKKERGGSQGAGSFLAIPVGTPSWRQPQALSPIPSQSPSHLHSWHTRQEVNCQARIQNGARGSSSRKGVSKTAPGPQGPLCSHWGHKSLGKGMLRTQTPLGSCLTGKPVSTACGRDLAAD